MTKMPRRILLTLALAAFSLCILCLSGCSGNASDTPSSSSQEETHAISSLEMSPESSDNIQNPQKPTMSVSTDEYTYITPFMTNNAKLVPIPQVLLDYENWMNSKGYLNVENMSPDAYYNGLTVDERKKYADVLNRNHKQINIIACALISEEEAHQLISGYYYDRYAEDFSDRHIYLILIDYWLNDNHVDNEVLFEGNCHEIFFTGKDSSGNEVYYDGYCPEKRGSLIFNDTLVSPDSFTRSLTELGFNLRNSNHLRPSSLPHEETQASSSPLEAASEPHSTTQSDNIQNPQKSTRAAGTDEYTYVTPFMTNNAKLVPIPQVLLDYENWINSKGYLNVENMSPYAYYNGLTVDKRKKYADVLNRNYKQINIMACALISEEEAHQLIGGYYDRYAEGFSDRHIYLVLVDYWLNNECVDDEHVWEGNRHELLFTGKDSSGNEVFYTGYGPEKRGNLIFNDTLVSPDSFTRSLTELGFNLRNSNHLRPSAAK